MNITQSVQLDTLNERLSFLIKRGEGIHVVDSKTDLEAKQYEVEAKSYQAAVNEYANPDITDAKERLSKLQAAKKMLLAPLDAVLDTVKQLRRAWEEGERQAAEKEAVKLNKNGKEPIVIKPSIPTLQGTQSRRLYKVAVVNEDALLCEWMKAKRGKSNYRAMFLRSYIKVDEAAIQAVARSEKGWKELKKENIPGLRFWTE